MISKDPTKFSLSLNKIMLSGLILVVIGFGAGTYLSKVQGLFSNAAPPSTGGQPDCRRENYDVMIYAQHLAAILRAGGEVTQLQWNTLLDLIQSRDECERRRTFNHLLG